MVGDRLNMPQTTVADRILTEVPDLEKLVQSRLKLKNPADLTGDAETPMPEVLAWAIKLPVH